MSIRCAIESITYLNHDTRRVLLKPDEPCSFQAGQYLNLHLPGHICPFSIASTPANFTQIELHIKPTTHSSDSIAIEQALDNESELFIEMPLGDCVLDKQPDNPLVLIAASTGITQMKCIIEHLMPFNREQSVFLYWGVINAEDLYFTKQLESWDEEFSNFHFIPVVSEPASSPTWTGKTGLVGQIAIEHAQSILGSAFDMDELTVYVSGSPGMVYATLDLFVAQGLPREAMHSDMFSLAPRS